MTDDLDFFGAFTDEDATFIALARRGELRVDHEGRIKFIFSCSNEYAAACLHELRGHVFGRRDGGEKDAATLSKLSASAIEKLK